MLRMRSVCVVKLGWPVVLTAVIIHKYSYIMIQGLTFQRGAGVSTLSSDLNAAQFSYFGGFRRIQSVRLLIG